MSKTSEHLVPERPTTVDLGIRTHPLRNVFIGGYLQTSFTQPPAGSSGTTPLVIDTSVDMANIGVGHIPFFGTAGLVEVSTSDVLKLDTATATLLCTALTVGSPTGGEKGTGSINAVSIYVNGVAVATTAGGGVAGSGTTAKLAYWSSSSAVAADTAFHLDSTNHRLGIGTTTPANPLSVAGIIESTTGGFKFPDGTVQTSAGGGLSGPGVNGRVAFWTGAATLGYASELLWDNTNKQLAVNHDGAVYTSTTFTDPRPGTIQIIRGSAASPETTNQPAIFANLIVRGDLAGTEPSGFGAAIRAYTRQQAGTSSGSFAIDAEIEQVTAGSGSANGGVGPCAVHGRATALAGNSSVFGAWFQAFDSAQSGVSPVGVEVNVDGTAVGRGFGLVRGINVIGFPGATSPVNDWGILISNFGNSLVIDNPDTAVDAAVSILIRNQSGHNANTTILAFEAAQPNAFKNGLDFTNATFTGTPLKMPSLKASSGTRYLIIDTNGNVSSSASAPSGT
jgi:hypothetical protein